MKAPSALVQVVVPAHNPGAFLGVALDSLRAQTFPDWSATVVDDGSAEDLSWVERIDPRIELVRQPQSGPGPARNTAIRRGESAYVAFLDADDLWLPDKLSSQLAYLEAHPETGLVSTGFRIVDADGSVVGPGFTGYNQSFEELLLGCGICISTVLVTRRVLSDDPFSSYFIVADWDLWLRIAAEWPIAHIPTEYAGYRMHGTNISNNYRRLYVEGVDLLEQYGDAGNGGIERLGHLVGWQALDHARSLWANRRLAEFARVFSYALRRNPTLALQLLARVRPTIPGRRS